MQDTFDRYLDRVMAIADFADDQREAHVRAELRDHLEEKLEALKSEGYEPAEALVKAMEDHGNPIIVGYRLRPWRLLDVRLRGTARGVIAIGPKAKGIVAIGGLAIGVFALGGVAIGAFSFGGFALALLLAWGGFAGGLLAYGGFALGVVAFGGMAVGVIAAGGSAFGLWVPGAGVVFGSYFTWDNVPNMWRAIGEWLSFDPKSPTERESFSRIIQGLSLATFSFVAIMLAIQLPLMARESKRLRRIDPSLLEL